jgi:prophage regulatory protein
MNPYVYDRLDLRRRGIKISNSTQLRMEAEGRFPKRRYLSPHTVVWLAADIDDFLARLAEEAGR